MSIELRQVPSKLERAAKWRIKRLMKALQKPRPSSIPAVKKEPEFRTLWGDAWYNEAIQSNKIFYESFSGNNALCNPSAIFARLLELPEFSTFEHVWSIATPELKAEFDAVYDGYPNILSVIYESVTYYQELSRSKYLFNNATFQPAFTKRKDQVYVNTWHGTPLKKMGYDVPGGAQGAYNILRNFASADYILSPNKFTTDTMLRKAFRLNGIFEGKVIEEGYPRIDDQFPGDDAKESTRQLLTANGINLITEKSIVVYAPTWKGASFHSPQDESDQLLLRLNRLQAELGDKYQFFLKVHQRVYKSASEVPGLRDKLIPNSIPTNKILGIADVLITDYSSIFFDFLATNRPILFHVPDHREYDTSRGFYIDLSELPGPTSLNLNELKTQLKSLGSGSDIDPEMTHRIAYENAREKYCPYEDGKVTDRVIDIIFNGQSNGYRILDLSECEKTKLLLFLGGMKPNGITSAALNLIASIDYDKFDVSIMIPQASRHSNTNLYESVDTRARQFLRNNTFPATRAHLDANKEFLGEDEPESAEMPLLISQLLQAEWRRLFGDSKFDHIIDFSGYSGFWSNILRQGPAESYSVWLHSNLKADAERIVDGKTINKRSLYNQFRAYKHYDNLISVSGALSSINADELAEFAHPSKFKHVSNTLDLKRLAAVSGDIRASQRISSETNLAGHTLDEALTELAQHYSWEDIAKFSAKAHRYETIFGCDDNLISFITVGRLSPEKNHERLMALQN